MKNPVASGKSSFPGALSVKRVDGVPTVFPTDTGLVSDSDNMLEVVYDHGPVQVGLLSWRLLPTYACFLRRVWGPSLFITHVGFCVHGASR